MSWASRWDDASTAKLLGIPEKAYPSSTCEEYPVAITNSGHGKTRRICLKGAIYQEVVEVNDVMDTDSNLVNPVYPGHPEKPNANLNEADVDARSKSVQKHPFLKLLEAVMPEFPKGVNIAEGAPRFECLVRTMTAGTWGPADYYFENLDSNTQEQYYKTFRVPLERLDL